MVAGTIQQPMTGGPETPNEFIDSTSSVLLLARSGSDAECEGCTSLLSEHGLRDSRAICITMTDSPDSQLSLWQQQLDDEMPEEAVILDAGSQLPAESQAAGSGAFPSLTLETLQSSVEPIDIGLAVSRHLGRWEAADGPSVLCLNSLTDLLNEWERDRVISLVTALNRQCSEMGVMCHHHLDPEANSEETVEMFRPLYDVVCEYIPDHGWTITGSPNDDAPTFRDSVTPPGGVAKGNPQEPETIPIPYSFDQVLELISSPRRRCLLYHLKDRTEHTMDLGELVERVYERERSIPARKTPKSRDEVSVSLAHNHLPRLDDLGILSYDADGNTVEYYPNPALESAMRYVERLELG